jgi:predicted naringenin-chalcone synthase
VLTQTSGDNVAFLHPPGTSRAPYEYENAEVVEAVAQALQYEPSRQTGLGRFAARTGVKTRQFSRPLAEVCATAPYEVHNEHSVKSVVSLTTEAARTAMTNSRVQPHEVATYIHIHATGRTSPSVADMTIEALGLDPTVQVIPMTELACAGGANALALANRLAEPGRAVLVAGAEDLSSSFQLHQDHKPGHHAFRFLFGDGGAAAVVTADRPNGPCLEILDSHRYLLPGSLHLFRGRWDHLGTHFDSEKEGLAAVGTVVRTLPWKSWEPEFGIVHPGSKLILESATEAGAASEHAMRYSERVLSGSGNCGGPTVLTVAAEAFESPPPPDAPGTLLSFGPGFRLEASRLRWCP